MLRRSDVVVQARLNTGDVLYVDLANAVGRTIWLRGDYSAEEPVVNLIRSHLKSGDIFFDVGANVGVFSLMAARIVGPHGRVHAFEPLPRLANLLRRTVETNRLSNVSVVEAAVHRTSGAASIAAMRDSAYSHLIGGANRIEDDRGGWTEVAVNTIALDEYVERNGLARLPRLIKMDIEGAEVEAIEGSIRVLSDSSGPDVICEVGWRHLARFDHTPHDVFDRFESMAYQALDPETGNTMKVGDLSDARYNVFFKKRSR